MLKRSLFIFALITLTTACASFPSGKSAKQLYLEATTRHMFTQSYNFKQIVNGSDFSFMLDDSFKAYLNKSSAATNENTNLNIEKIMLNLLKGFKTETYGAYDPQRGMMEMISGVAFSQNNIDASMYLPILLNWKDPSLAMGPSLFNYFLLPESHNGNKQGLIFKLSDAPKEISDTTMRYVKNLLPAFIKNTYDGFSEIDEKNFRFKTLETSDENFNADRKISYTYSLQDVLTSVEKTLSLSLAQLENDFTNTHNIAQRQHMLTPKELKTISEMVAIFKPSIEKSLGADSEFSLLQEGMTFSGDLYLDYRNRPKYIVSKFKLNASKGNTISYTTHTEISNYGAATFTFDTHNVTYFNGADIIKEKMPEFKKLLKK